MNTGPFFALLVLIAVIGGGIGSAYAVVTDDDEHSADVSGPIIGEAPSSDQGGSAPFGGSLISGSVASIDGDVLIIETADGQQPVTLTSDTMVVTTSSVDDARDQITPGSQVSAIGPTAAEGTTTVARLTLGAAGGGFGGGGFGGGGGGLGAVVGTVAGLEGDTLAIDTTDGPRNVQLTANTTVVIPSSVGDVLVAAEVIVFAAPGDDGELTAVFLATGVGGFGGLGGGRVRGEGQRLP